MNYDMLHNILGTVLAYYETNKEVLTDKQIIDLLEQKNTIIKEMKKSKQSVDEGESCNTCKRYINGNCSLEENGCQTEAMEMYYNINL